MRAYIKSFITLTLGVVSTQCFPQALRVESFISNSTASYPEVNLIVFNDGPAARHASIYIDYSTPDGLDCGFAARTQHPWRFADAYEERTTIAVIPAGRWTHRAFSIGAYATEYPCSVRYSIETVPSEHNVSITGNILVTFPYELKANPSYDSKIASDYPIDYVVERVPDYGAILVRILLRSTLHEPSDIYVSDKQIINCDASLDYRYPYVQGLDGGRLVVGNKLPAVAVIPIIDDSRMTASCKLVVTFSTRGEQPQSTARGTALKKVSIPLVPTGTYLTPKDYGHPLPKIERQ